MFQYISKYMLYMQGYNRGKLNIYTSKWKLTYMMPLWTSWLRMYFVTDTHAHKKATKPISLETNNGKNRMGLICCPSF